jgi:23S rRNA pseudouridine1911/1915/1917 synthase
MSKSRKKSSLPPPAAIPSPGLPRRRFEAVVDARLIGGAEASPGSGTRADRYIAEVLGILSRSQLKARDALILVDGKTAKPSRLLTGGEGLVVEWVEEPSQDLVPEDIPLGVIYEDARVIVVDKVQGMVTHPGHGNRRGTLANALLGRLKAAGADAGSEMEGGGAPEIPRAGIVHRLDKDTSGLIIAAKDAEAQAFLAAQFKERLTRKEYLAITRGIPDPPEGRIENRLGRDPRERKRFAAVREGGKAALTDYRVIASYRGVTGGRSQSPGYALVSLRPRTGRTHQLRVHMAGLGTPILGDPIYGKKDPDFPEASLMLHAYRLRITLPGASSGAEGGEAGAKLFKAPIPERFRRLLAYLEKNLVKG